MLTLRSRRAPRATDRRQKHDLPTELQPFSPIERLANQPVVLLRAAFPL